MIVSPIFFHVVMTGCILNIPKRNKSNNPEVLCLQKVPFCSLSPFRPSLISFCSTFFGHVHLMVLIITKALLILYIILVFTSCLLAYRQYRKF